MKKTIGVLYGGRSSEHEISIITALQAIGAVDTLRYDVVPIYIDMKGKWHTGKALLQKSFYKKMASFETQHVTLLPDPSIKGIVPINKQTCELNDVIPIDVYLLAFHGQQGEDGCIQGLLELADAPYTGCNVAASAVTMNKYFSKIFLKEHGIPVLPAVLLSKKEAQKRGMDSLYEKVSAKMSFPLFVKPCHLGSSIGISSAEDRSILEASMAKAFRYDSHLLVEPCIKNMMEINVSVLDNIASVVEIPISSGHALSYEDKYLRGGTKTESASQGMASLSRVIDPKDLDPAIKSKVTQYALEAYVLLNCKGVARMDFIYDLDKGELYFNEINSIPGSLSFYLWHKSSPGLLYTELIDKMVAEAYERKAERLSLRHDVGFRAL